MDSADILNNDPGTAAKNIAKGYKVRGFDYGAEVFQGGIHLSDYNVPIKPSNIATVKNTYQFFKGKGRIKGDEPDWNELINNQFLERAQAARK